MKMSIKLLSLFILFIILLGIGIGCGPYSFSGSTIPAHIKTVSIPLFEDKTAEFGVDQKITDAITQVLEQDNTLKVADVRQSDSMIKGTILRVEDQAGQYDRQETVSDYKIKITVKVAFEDIKNQKVLWEETLTQEGTYNETDTDRDAGIDEAIEKLKTDIFNRTVSGW